MSGFSADWLALRESADCRARAPAVLRATCGWAVGRQAPGTPLSVIDLGAGSGNMLRFLAPRLARHLMVPQAWTLIDNDPTLLEIARRKPLMGPLSWLCRTGSLSIRSAECDLATIRPLARMLQRARLVTASAVFDLVSATWCRDLVRSIARPGTALYAPLTFDGRMSLAPPDPLDAALRALFNRHQRRDKGFGPALGPAAARSLIHCAAAAGAVVAAARSDWRLGPPDVALIRSLLAGWTAAAAQESPKDKEEIDTWSARRRRQLAAAELRIIVGHVDVLATW
jgi:SAM-dependent methyltransferase